MVRTASRSFYEDGALNESPYDGNIISNNPQSDSQRVLPTVTEEEKKDENDGQGIREPEVDPNYLQNSMENIQPAAISG